MTYLKAQYIHPDRSRVWALRDNGEQVSASPGTDAWDDVHAQAGLRIGTFDDPVEPDARDVTDVIDAGAADGPPGGGEGTR